MLKIRWLNLEDVDWINKAFFASKFVWSFLDTNLLQTQNGPTLTWTLPILVTVLSNSSAVNTVQVSFSSTQSKPQHVVYNQLIPKHYLIWIFTWSNGSNVSTECSYLHINVVFKLILHTINIKQEKGITVENLYCVTHECVIEMFLMC